MGTNLLYLSGLTYKISTEGRVFVERNGEWCRSFNLTAEQFGVELKKQNRIEE